MITERVSRPMPGALSVGVSINSTAAIDSAVLFVIGLVSAAPYIDHLGLYSDDWSFVQVLVGAHDHSFMTLFSAVLPGIATRPVQAAYLAALFAVFGTDVVRLHLVGILLQCASAPLAYLALRRFGVARVVALLVAVIYGALPSYSADRFWLASAQSLISACFFFISMYALGRAATSGQRWRYLVALSAGALVISGLAYEVFLPLFVIGSLLLPAAVRVPAERRATILAVNPALVVILAVAKFAFTARLGSESLHDRVSWLLHLAKGALQINVGDFGFGLPLVALKLFASRPSWVAAASAAAAALLVYSYLLRTRNEILRGFRRLAVAGAICFGGGYAIFLTNNNALMTPTGSGNRVGIAAAFGMALLFAAAAVWVAERLRDTRVRVHVVAAFGALVVGSGVLTNATLASYWQDAATQQAAVLQALKTDEPTLPANSTVVIDGICPYVGPGVVFETTWDVGAALQVLYMSPTLAGDVVTPRMSVAADGLHSYTYQTVTVHRYGPGLFIYDYRSRAITTLSSAADATAYFASHPPRQCQPGEPGYGASVI